MPQASGKMSRMLWMIYIFQFINALKFQKNILIINPDRENNSVVLQFPDKLLFVDNVWFKIKQHKLKDKCLNPTNCHENSVINNFPKRLKKPILQLSQGQKFVPLIYIFFSICKSTGSLVMFLNHTWNVSLDHENLFPEDYTMLG